MKKIAIYGGTFDPIHIGHLITAQYVLQQRNLDKIIFIPCFISPHKIESNSASHLDRFEMVKLAIENHKGFDFSCYEIDKGDVSFTIDTIVHFKNYYEQVELIIGYDNLLKFDTWKEPDKIVKMVNLIVLQRSYDNSDMNDGVKRFIEKAVFLDTPIIDISSTEIRNRIKNNLSIDFLVPDKVKDYIIEKHLYE